MEIKELQKAWAELNERVGQNELVHQQQIIEMLSQRKESHLQRMIRLEKGTFLFMSGVTLIIVLHFIHSNGQIALWPGVFGLLLFALTSNFIGIRLLTKIKKETNLEIQIKNVLRYKKYFQWALVIGYILALTFIFIFLYTYRHVWWLVLTISTAMLTGALIDFFLFHYVSDNIKEIMNTNKELKKLNT